jgi:hypothetical protein
MPNEPRLGLQFVSAVLLSLSLALSLYHSSIAKNFFCTKTLAKVIVISLVLPLRRANDVIHPNPAPVLGKPQ